MERIERSIAKKAKSALCIFMSFVLVCTLNPAAAYADDIATDQAESAETADDATSEESEDAAADGESSDTSDDGTNQDAVEEAADDEADEDEDEEEPELAAESSANSWRYSGGYLIDSATDGSDTDTSSITIQTDSSYPYSTWKSSYGSSYLGIATSSSKTSKVAVSGATRVVIDVSEHNGTISWSKVAAAGVTAAIIRCGYGDDYSSQDDECFLYNVQQAQKYGIEIGIYLYSYAKRTSGSASAASEAEHVIRLLEEAGLDPGDLDLPVFYDLEDSGTVGTLSNSKLGDVAETFCDALEDEGYAVGIYSNESWWTSKLTDSAFDTESWYKWVASYPESASYASTLASYAAAGSSGAWDGVDMWQFTSHGTLSGIASEYVDVSFDYTGSGNYETPRVTIESATIASSLAKVTLTWSKKSTASGYYIYRRTSSASSYTKIATVTGSSTVTYADTTVKAGTSYYYKVRPYYDSSSGSYSSAKSVYVGPAKTTISSASTTTAGKVKVSWVKTSRAQGYVIYRSTNGGSYSKVKTITSQTTLSWTDSSVKPGRVYRYKIKAYSKATGSTVYSSGWSSVKKVTAKPAKATIKSTSSSKKRTGKTTWSKVTNATGYQLAYRIKGKSKWYYVTTTKTSYTLTYLNNKNYYVKVRAYTTYKGTKYYGSWSSQKALKVK